MARRPLRAASAAAPVGRTGAVLIVIAVLFTAIAATAADEKPNYTDHIRPIFREHCFSCHSQSKAQNDLKLDTYESLMQGGASGEVIEPGDPDSSYLWGLVSHGEEPFMPPNQDAMAEEKLAIIRGWIEAGALKDSGSVATVKKPAGPQLTVLSGASRPDGPAVVPVGLTKTPATHVARAGAVTALAASPWAPVLAVAGQHQIAFYQTDTAEYLGIIPFAEGIPHVLRFNRAGSLLMAAGGRAASLGVAAVYDVKSGQRLFQVGDELDAVLAADISADNSRIALGGPERIVKVYSTKDGSLLGELRKHTDWVLAIEFSPDAVLLASADRAGGLFLWETESLQEFQNLQGHKGAVTAVSWRDDSNVLASGSEDGTIKLWNIETGKELKSIKAHSGGVTAVAFAHDGKLVSCGRDRVTRIWDPAGKPLRSLAPLADIAMEIAISHDGQRVATGDWLGTVRLASVADGKTIADLSTRPAVK